MKTVAVDLNPATREVATGTEVYTREVGSRLSAAAPDLRWLFFASRARSGLGVDMLVVPMARLWSQVRLPLALRPAHPDLLFVPAHAIPFGWLGKSLTVVHDLAFERHPQAYSLAERSYLQLTTSWAPLPNPLAETSSTSITSPRSGCGWCRSAAASGASARQRRPRGSRSLGWPATSCSRSAASKRGRTSLPRWQRSNVWTGSRWPSPAPSATSCFRSGFGPHRAAAFLARLTRRRSSCCISGPRPWWSRAYTRASAFRFWRRWHAARSSWRRARRRCRRWAATPPSTWMIPTIRRSWRERSRQPSATRRCGHD